MRYNGSQLFTPEEATTARLCLPAAGGVLRVPAAGKHNRAVVASSGVTSWLPSYRIAPASAAAAKKRPLRACTTSAVAAFSGLGMMTVLTVDLEQGLQPVDSVAVMTDARIVYASPESLYVATERWTDRPDPAKPTAEQTGVVTAIHKFDISSPSRTQYRGSGQASGFLLSQWSLSEYPACSASSAPRRPRGGAGARRASRS